MRISATVWDGADYLPTVWDAWLAEDQNSGFLLAGELLGKLVAIQHTSLQPARVAWLEGIRVDPKCRNQGIGGRMMERAIDLARDHGCVRARLSTVRKNGASVAIAGSHGFREIGEFVIFSAPPADASSASGHDESASKEDRSADLKGPVRVVAAQVSSGDLQSLRERQGEADTLIAHHWTAYDMPGQRTPEEFSLSYVCKQRSQIVGMALASESREGTDISVAYLGGSREAVAALALAMRREAHTRGLESAYGMFRLTPDREAGLKDAGYERNEELVVVVFERDL